MSNINLPIYLDYSSTTPVDPRVAQKMSECLMAEGNFGNPASRSHQFGWVAEEAVDIARNQIADLVNADPREIVFTSGATESNNLAIKGAATFYQKHFFGTTLNTFEPVISWYNFKNFWNDYFVFKFPFYTLLESNLIYVYSCLQGQFAQVINIECILVNLPQR